ncbi:MAG: glycosyltransferase family 4 protein [Methanomicrobiales archaeon]|nr:glycosyltransferase family 4 protein [Methanomicrobiales archaeon]
MAGHYSINKKEDFDLYFEDLVPFWIPGKRLGCLLQPIFAFAFIIKNAKVVHLPFSGGPLGNFPIWWIEPLCLKIAKIKIIILPYGSDYQMYSSIIDMSWKFGLLHSYPDGAMKEQIIREKINCWSKYADCIITGFQFDGIGRWDCLPYAIYIIDTDLWTPKIEYSKNNGVNGPVKIFHSPNHRGCKGTEFLIDAVNKLRNEGLMIELLLMEKVSNEDIRKVMPTADIHVDQLLMGYAMSAIEGLATGLPVLSNLENEQITRVFRRFSYLNECPIISTSPENLLDNLRILITNPLMREQIGKASRSFAEKYHSYKTGQYLFSSVYDKIIKGDNIDLMNLFHPILSDYVKQSPIITSPLKENKLPKNDNNV